MLAPNTVPSPTIAGAGFIALDILISNRQDWRQRAGGTCGNILAILSFLGFKTFPIARLGTDSAADLIISELESVGADCQHVQRDPTARTPRVVEFLPEQPGAAHRFTFTCPMCQRRFPRRSKPTFEQASQSVHDVNPGLFFLDRADSITIELAASAQERGAVVMFEPSYYSNSRHFTMALKLSNIVKYSTQRMGQCMEPLLRDIGATPRLVVETLDGGGLRYKTRSREPSKSVWLHQGPFLVDHPIDQAGAGDWCSAGLISRILTGGTPYRWRDRTIRRALAFGQALAAASILFEGPRGYIEKSSRRAVLRAATSTLRQGKLPEWITQNQISVSQSLASIELAGACQLCLVPICEGNPAVVSMHE